MKNSIKVYISLMLMILLMSIAPPINSSAYNDNKIKIGYFPGYGTIVNENSDSDIGYGYDMFMEIARYTGWEYEFIPMSWEEGMSMLSSGDIDLFGPMQKSEEREEKYDFTNLSFGSEYATLYALEDAPIYYDDFEAFNSLVIGASSDCYFLDDFMDYSDKYGFTPNIVYTNSMDIYGDMKKGDYNLYLSGDMLKIPNTKAVATISSQPFYYAVSNSAEGILDNLKLAKIGIDSGWESV